MRALWAVVALSACTLPAVRPELQKEFVATGSIQLHSRFASFDSVRVRSTRTNLAMRTDGSWAGVIDDRPVDVNIYENRIAGIGLQLTRVREGNNVIFTGQVHGRLVRFEFSDEVAMIRDGGAVTLVGRVVGEKLTTYGPGGELQLIGEAGLQSPPWPQFALALVAAN